MDFLEYFPVHLLHFLVEVLSVPGVKRSVGGWQTLLKRRGVVATSVRIYVVHLLQEQVVSSLNLVELFLLSLNALCLELQV